MRIEILGCSGGIGAGLRTTSLAIDNDILIDCGTGVGDLDRERMVALRHVFLTHSHLDHIAALPLLVDTLFDELQGRPLQVHCLPSTFEVLRTHIFNWKVWPDFFSLPDPVNPVIQHCPIEPGGSFTVGGRTVRAIAVNHTVPALAYHVSDARCAMAFSGDTTTGEGLWSALNACERLDFLVLECAYSDEEMALSQLARHYCPTLLKQDVATLRHDPRIGISHLKAGDEDRIFGEVQAALPDRKVWRLSSGEVVRI